VGAAIAVLLLAVAAAVGPGAGATGSTITLTVKIQARELDATGRPAAAVSTTARIAVWYAASAGLVSPAIRGWAYPRLLYPDPRAIRYGYATGSLSVTVPRTSAVRIAASKGPEYRAVSLALKPGATTATVVLTRWIDEARAGWYSGDDHVHFHYDNATSSPSATRMTLTDVATMAAGEDLRITNLMVANTSGRKSGSDELWDAALFGTQRASGGRIIRVSQELRHEFSGHLVVLGGSRLALPSYAAEPDSSNSYLSPSDTSAIAAMSGTPVVAYTHPTFGGSATYAGFFDKELPVTAAVGRLDGLDLLGPTNSEPNARDAYYDLLGAGLHLAAMGGTDAELDAGPLDYRLDDRGGKVYDARQNPIGCDRMYVKVAGPLTYAGWLDGIRAGRTFVTNGPLLDLSAAAGTGTARGIGSTVVLAAGGPVTVRGLVRSQTPVSATVVVGMSVGPPQLIPVSPAADGTFSVTVHMPATGWLALRAQGSTPSCDANTATYAHTSPVYVQVGDGSIANTDALERLSDWTAAGWADLRARPASAFAASGADAARTTIVDQWRAANAWYCARLPADASHATCVTDSTSGAALASAVARGPASSRSVVTPIAFSCVVARSDAGSGPPALPTALETPPRGTGDDRHGLTGSGPDVDVGTPGHVVVRTRKRLAARTLG
jgi:TolB protein